MVDSRYFCPGVGVRVCACARGHKVLSASLPCPCRPLNAYPSILFRYSMGLFHATRKRLIVSWSFIFGIATIVAAVKRLPYPWRSVIDGETICPPFDAA